MFEEIFTDLIGHKANSWQRRLFIKFVKSEIPAILDLPTGLGKTSVMALWLLARGRNPALPRRLVYVVGRRAVVDQASTPAEKPAEKSAGRAGGGLAVSTLRGKRPEARSGMGGLVRQEPIGNIPPAKAEARYYALVNDRPMAA